MRFNIVCSLKLNVQRKRKSESVENCCGKVASYISLCIHCVDANVPGLNGYIQEVFSICPCEKIICNQALCALRASQQANERAEIYFGRRSVGVGGLPVNIISVHEFFPPPGAALMEEQKVFMLIEIAPKKRQALAAQQRPTLPILYNLWIQFSASGRLLTQRALNNQQ